MQHALGPCSNVPVGTAILGNILACCCNWFFVYRPRIFGTNKLIAAALRFILKYPTVSTWSNPFEQAFRWRLNVFILACSEKSLKHAITRISIWSSATTNEL